MVTYVSLSRRRRRSKRVSAAAVGVVGVSGLGCRLWAPGKIILGQSGTLGIWRPGGGMTGFRVHGYSAGCKAVVMVR
jgi:hypothetical protein